MRLLFFCLLVTLIGCTGKIKTTDLISLKCIPVKEGEYWGFIDQSGKMVIAPQFKKAYNFSEGLAVVQVTDDKFGFINEKGEFKIPAEYREASGFSEGLANVVRENQRIEYIDKNGKTVFITEDAIEMASPFKEGMAKIEINNKVGYINKKGKIVIPATYQSGDFFSEGLALVSNEKNEFESGNQFYINKEDKVVINKKFETAAQFREGLALIKMDGKFGFINKEGKIVIPATLDETHFFYNGLCAAKKGELWGFIDKKGKWKINPQFREVSGFTSSGLSAAQPANNDKWGFINRNGEMEIEPQFDDVVYPFVDGVAVIKLNANYGLVGTDGKYKANPVFEIMEIYSRQYSAVFTDHFDATGFIKFVFNKYDATSFKNISANSTLSSLKKNYPGLDRKNYNYFVPMDLEHINYLLLRNISFVFQDGFITPGVHGPFYDEGIAVRKVVINYYLGNKASAKEDQLLNLIKDVVPKDMKQEYKEGQYLLIYNNDYYVKLTAESTTLHLVLAFTKNDALTTNILEANLSDSSSVVRPVID
jgi:bifunctional DNA-binding transcriptional regulator/antitoxin component of YhaV-PrlF toxin-antitoxin module